MSYDLSGETAFDKVLDCLVDKAAVIAGHEERSRAAIEDKLKAESANKRLIEELARMTERCKWLEDALREKNVDVEKVKRQADLLHVAKDALKASEPPAPDIPF